MSAGEQPHLVALPGGTASSAPGADPAGSRARVRGGLLPWLLGLVLLACAIGWALEHREAASLEARLSETQARLDETRLRLEARQRHLESVRSGVAGLAVGVEELEALVSSDPEASRPVQSPSRP